MARKSLQLLNYPLAKGFKLSYNDTRIIIRLLKLSGGFEMLKFLTNTLFIIILFVLLSGMPVNTDIMSVSVFNPVVEPMITEAPTAQNFKLSDTVEINAYNPETLSIAVTGDVNDFTDFSFSNLEIKITTENGYNELINADTLNPIWAENSNSNERIASFDLSKLKPLLSEDLYSLTIYSNLDNISGQSEGTFYISTLNKVFLKSSEQVISGKLYMTLFYPTRDYNHLVPITQVVTYPENRTRTLYKALYAGPIDTLGLYTSNDGILPYAPRIYVKNGMASVYFNASELTDYTDHAPLILESITNTLSGLDFISEVNFYQNNTHSGLFGSEDLSKTYQPVSENLTYYGYSNASDYMMLIPIKSEILNTESVLARDTDDIMRTWKNLSSTHATLQVADGFFPTVPSNVYLKKYSFENGILTLDVSDTFLNSFKGSEEYNALMVESILYSFTSLRDIQSVKITVDDQPLVNFYGYNFSESQSPNAYINLAPSN